MENESSQMQKKSMMPMIIVAAVVVIIIVGAVMFSMSGNNQPAQNTTAEQQNPNPTVPVEEVEAKVEYTDGTYDVVGNYTSPGGEESIDVTITLANGVVTEAEVVSNATRPISKQMQGAFIAGFEEQVVGKNIDEINVTKVSSSSLTPKGFMDALEKVKAEASA